MVGATAALTSDRQELVAAEVGRCISAEGIVAMAKLEIAVAKSVRDEAAVRHREGACLGSLQGLRGAYRQRPHPEG